MSRFKPSLPVALAVVSVGCAALLIRRGWGRVPVASGPRPVEQEWSSVPTPHGAIRVHLSCPKEHDGEYVPLLLFAPSWAARAPESPLLLADIASHGYCICAFDDVAFDPTPAAESAEDGRARAAVLDWSDRVRWRQLLAAGERRAAWEVAKARAILDGVQQLARAGAQQYRGVDIDRVGFVGYSFGGAVAAETALQDKRIRAAANLDGWLFGAASKRALPRPFLMIVSPSPPEDRASPHEATRIAAEWAETEEALLARSLDGTCVRRVEFVASHEDFSDALFAPGLKGRVRLAWSSRLALRAGVMRALIDFLDLHLKRAGGC
jgi:dienelactone hydrolase